MTSPPWRLRLLSRLLVPLAGTALGAFLLVRLLRSVNLDQLGVDFSHVAYGPLLLAIPPFLINLLLKVPRWALLFGEDAPDLDTLFGGMNVGYAVNALLPLRVGEIVRAYWIRDRSGIGMLQTLSTIAVERVTDGVVLLVLLLLLAPTVAFPHNLLVPALIVGAVFIVVMAGMVFLAYSASRHEMSWLGQLLSRLEAGRWAIAGRALRGAIVGLQALRNRRAVLLLATYTGLIWASNSILIWLVLRAFHISVPLAAGVLLTVVLNLGMAVPSSPGYVGVFEYLMVLTLSLYGVAQPPALAAALAFHVVAFVPVTVIGLIYIARSGVQGTLRILRASATRSS